jgi:hypothetical protein
MLSVSVFDRLILGKGSQELITPDSYSHTIEAVGGYWPADFTFKKSRNEMDDWMQSGIGRHVEVYHDSLERVWEGFVNEITVNYGALSVTRGPFLDIGNRVSVQYSGVDTSVIPPIVGVEVQTLWEDNDASQDRYGIWEKLLTSGEISATDAESIRDTYLAENSQPATSHTWSPASAGQASITVNCLGYVHLLNYIYNQTTNVGQVDTDAKILEVLAEDPNVSWLDVNTDHVGAPASAVQVPRYEYENRLAWELIEDCVSRGDANANRWLFGIYNDREAWYWQAPDDLEYTTMLSDPGQRVYDIAGVQVPYALLRPGHWLLFADILVGQQDPDSLQDDPRYLFIERVTYTAPNGLTLEGGQSNKLSQIIARLGLGGLG